MNPMDYVKALSEVLGGKWECPECGDTSAKDCNDAGGYCCVKCDWQDYTDLEPIEVELRGVKFSIKD